MPITGAFNDLVKNIKVIFTISKWKKFSSTNVAHTAIPGPFAVSDNLNTHSSAWVSKSLKIRDGKYSFKKLMITKDG